MDGWVGGCMESICNDKYTIKISKIRKDKYEQSPLWNCRRLLSNLSAGARNNRRLFFENIVTFVGQLWRGDGACLHPKPTQFEANV